MCGWGPSDCQKVSSESLSNCSIPWLLLQDERHQMAWSQTSRSCRWKKNLPEPWGQNGKYSKSDATVIHMKLFNCFTKVRTCSWVSLRSSQLVNGVLQNRWLIAHALANNLCKVSTKRYHTGLHEMTRAIGNWLIQIPVCFTIFFGFDLILGIRRDGLKKIEDRLANRLPWRSRQL